MTCDTGSVASDLFCRVSRQRCFYEMNQTNQTNQIIQINQTNQMNQKSVSFQLRPRRPGGCTEVKQNGRKGQERDWGHV
jgi:hypothetical protein